MTSRQRIDQAARRAGLQVKDARYTALVHGEKGMAHGGWMVWLSDGSGHIGWDADEVIEAIETHTANSVISVKNEDRSAAT